MTKKRGAVLAAVLFGVGFIGANVLPSGAQRPRTPTPTPTLTPTPTTPAQPSPPPIATEFLTGRAVFTDDVDLKLKLKLDDERTVVRAKDPSRTLVARFTVQPGAQFPWHTHPGPVIVNVTQGELVYVAAADGDGDDADGDDADDDADADDDDVCVERAYPAGTAFVDPGHGHVHTALNRTGRPTVFVATFFEAPAQGPLLIPAQPPADCNT
jgi:hypothetical protein